METMTDPAARIKAAMETMRDPARMKAVMETMRDPAQMRAVMEKGGRTEAVVKEGSGYMAAAAGWVVMEETAVETVVGILAGIWARTQARIRGGPSRSDPPWSSYK